MLRLPASTEWRRSAARLPRPGDGAPPAIWLMDEPLGTLDADQRMAMRFLREQQLEAHVTTVYVTHDQEEAMSLADRIVVMRDGQILQIGTPDEVYDRPADLFVANFVGSPGMNFVAGALIRIVSSDCGWTDRLAGSLRPGKATLGIRCEYVRIDERGFVEGTIEVEEYLGAFRMVYVQTPIGRICVREGANVTRAVGEKVKLAFDPEHLSLFDEQGVRMQINPDLARRLS